MAICSVSIRGKSNPLLLQLEVLEDRTVPSTLRLVTPLTNPPSPPAVERADEAQKTSSASDSQPSDSQVRSTQTTRSADQAPVRESPPVSNQISSQPAPSNDGQTDSASAPPARSSEPSRNQATTPTVSGTSQTSPAATPAKERNTQATPAAQPTDDARSTPAKTVNRQDLVETKPTPVNRTIRPTAAVPTDPAPGDETPPPSEDPGQTPSTPRQVATPSPQNRLPSADAEDIPLAGAASASPSAETAVPSSNMSEASTAGKAAPFEGGQALPQGGLPARSGDHPSSEQSDTALLLEPNGGRTGFPGSTEAAVDLPAVGPVSTAMPLDLVALDRALETFLNRLGEAGQTVLARIGGVGLAPWLAALAGLLTAYEVARRQRIGARQLTTQDDERTVLLPLAGGPHE